MVCSNGAMTVALPNEEILEDIYLPSEIPEKLVRSLRSEIPGIAFAYEFKRGVKAQYGLAERLPSGVPLGDPIDDVLDLDPRPVRKILTWHDDFELSSLGRLISEIVGNDVEISSSGLNFFEFGTIIFVIVPITLRQMVSVDSRRANRRVSPLGNSNEIP